MRANEISRLLAGQVDGVVRVLLPNGKRKGHEWRAGSVGGDAGESLGVHMTGDKAGVWADFSTGESGDMIGLWMAVKGIGLREACTEAMAYLGIREDRIDPPPRRSWAKPTREGVSKLSEEHRAWLECERRIAPATITAYRVATKDGWLMFPYLRDGELVAAKYRKLPKQFRQDADCEPSLFGWQAMPADARTCVICEGELDALAWHTYGVCALSVPMGGGKGAKQGWIETEFERLSLFDTIFVAMDGDGPGQEGEIEIVERLGRERCRVVRLPGKDANQCLMDGVPGSVILDCLRDARTLDPSELRDIGDFEDAIWSEFTRVDQGLTLPWEKCIETIKLRPGETSIWAGVNGHGKSTVVSQVLGYQASIGVPCCAASMEYRTPMWMARMARQIAGTANPTETFVRHIVRELRGKLMAFDVAGSAKSARILEVFRYAVRRYRIELFVIDNLTKCGFADDDYAGQKSFVEAISDLARETQTHIAIVAHMRKGESEDKPSGKMSVKGSGGIVDMADTLIEVWRNKPRERAIKTAEDEARAMFLKTHVRLSDAEILELVPEKHRESPDTLLLVHKQRATGQEPVVGLWFDPATTQYLGSPKAHPAPYVKPGSVSGAVSA